MPKPFFIGKSPNPVLSDNPSSLTDEWLNSHEAAQFLKVSVAMLRNMASNGQLPFYKLGRRNRYKKSELEALLLQNKRGLCEHKI